MTFKIGFVGAGSVAGYHIEAAKAAGFELFAICAKPNSKRSQVLAKRYSFKHASKDISALRQLKLDAVAIVVATDQSLNVYRHFLDLGIPILIEKPVSAITDDFRNDLDLDRKSTLVGYNRRFYSSIQYLKAQTLNQREFQSHWNISELPSRSDASQEERISMLKANSVHLFDLMAFLLGEIDEMSVKRIFDSEGYKGFSALCQFKSGSIATVSLSFGIPSNTSVDFLINNRNLRLKPLEEFSDFSSMQITAPTIEVPYKRYLPVNSTSWKKSPNDLKFKPGFLEQYLELMRMVVGEPRTIGASLRDAFNAQQLADKFQSITL